jgi:ABC-2 type transport system permease protein
MMHVPGSIPWLFRHELRLLWFNAGSGKPGKAAARRPGTAGLAMLGAVWVALHALAYFAIGKIAGIGLSDPRIFVAVSALLFGLMTFMLSSALKSSVMVLFERGDLDLLLSSPLPSRSIFTVRLATVAVGTAALYLLSLGPFAHMGALLGHPGWLALYPVLLGMATIVACAAMLLTLGLVRTIGARRTRVVAQIIGALAGAMIFILSQVFSHFSSRMEAQAVQAFARAFASGGPLGIDSPLWLPGRALLGEPLPVLGIVALAAAAFAFTVGRTHRFFVHGLQQAASSSRAARRPAGGVRYRFGRGLMATVLFKEWRLILRDPHLISQVALQLIYLLPLFFVIFQRGELRLTVLGAGLTLLCSSLTASLAWIVVSAEDAPDLLRLSPAPQRTIRFAKLGAAVLPALGLVLIPLAWLLVREPLAGLITLVCVTGAVCTAALIVHWCGRPGSRSDFQVRGKSDVLTTILELCNSIAWGGLAWALSALVKGASEKLIVMTLIAALSTAVVLGLSWFLRRPQA